MKNNSQITISKRVLTTIIIVLLTLTLFNTYLIFSRTDGPADTSAVSYDYVLSVNSGKYVLKNMASEYSFDVPNSASSALNLALSNGKTVYINPGNYTLTSDVIVYNKLSAKIISDGATINGNGHRIIIRGENYSVSKYATISGLTLINTTVRIEDSFRTTISNIVFENTSVALEFANLHTWSEYNQIENCQFTNAATGIAFRSPVGNATGSYASSIISRCSFNVEDNSVGIMVESNAQFSDCQLQDVRFWLGEYGKTNQTGIYNDGAMEQTLLEGVVFESFVDHPNNLYAIDLGQNCGPTPIIDGGVSFLGDWTARIHNLYGKWVSGVGGAFEKTNLVVTVGENNQYMDRVNIQTYPLKMYTFKPEIAVSNLASGEVVTVRVRFEYVDNVLSDSVEKSFSSSQTVWLNDDDMMRLYPSQSIIWAVYIDAKSTLSSSSAMVMISGYGTAG